MWAYQSTTQWKLIQIELAESISLYAAPEKPLTLTHWLTIRQSGDSLLMANVWHAPIVFGSGPCSLAALIMQN